ncbi:MULTISPECIES: hypothetical protein [unclassified Sphingopyxis]|jgi:hypothetical protein|uniref:hypothetical protein n=1 Tax=unclassified Sphingopyxis TaxID=2614943 RepID=UPI00285C7BBC|nr:MULTISPECIES: hypothetical protein [unclassified Sphingopyxis]MDR6833384.1 hypothetical protein [Sphingopyxis sp. BE122]MDR7225653.1 hypothetical protein [Sphingopyxis sp. BE259]
MQRTEKKGELFKPIGVSGLTVMLWLGFVAASIAIHHDAIASLTFWDPDNAMRLAQVRDLAAGQGWFDTVQYRANPAGGGGLMHWSRFIDVQIVGLTTLLGVFFPAELAERLALALYPPLLVLPLLLLLGRILAMLGDRQVVICGLIIASTTITFLHHFAPMNIDHHNWQILLALTMLWATFNEPSFSAGMIAAFAGTLYVEISIEGLPFLALFGGLFVLDWSRDPSKKSRLVGFSVGLLIVPTLWLLAFRGPSYLIRSYCDSFSLPYLIPIAITALCLLAILANARLSSASPALRLSLGALAGGIGAAVFALFYPACLEGPFGDLEPLVRTYWYDPIQEGRPIWHQDLSMAVVYGAPTIVGLIALGFSLWKSRESDAADDWGRLALIVLVATVLGMLVMRMTAVAHAFMVPAFPVLAMGLWRWSRARLWAWQRIGGSLAFLLAVPIVDVALALVVAGNDAESTARTDQSLCNLSDMSVAMAREPATLLFSSIQITPALLVGTPHSVVTTGHHRNHATMNRVLTAFLSPPPVARPLVVADGAQYLVVCDKELEKLAKARPDGLAAYLLHKKPVDWLAPEARLSTGGFRVYRIDRASNAVQSPNPKAS